MTVHTNCRMHKQKTEIVKIEFKNAWKKGKLKQNKAKWQKQSKSADLSYLC